MNQLNHLPVPLPPLELFQAAIDGLAEPFFVKDLQHRWTICNQAFCTLLGKPRAEVIGHTETDFFPPDQVTVFWHYDDQVIDANAPLASEEQITYADGITRTVIMRKYPLHDDQGHVIGMCGFIVDISAIKQREQQLAELEGNLAEKAATVESQRLLLEQVAVPVIQVWERVLLLPLIGVIDSHRAARLLESMLDAIARYRAEVLLLDITGVPLVDTAIAGHIVRGIQAAQLLGCRSIVVGISPHIAQTLVQLGIDFSMITTRATLQQGLEFALTHLNYRVTRQPMSR